MRNLKELLIEVRESWAEGGLGQDVKAALLEHRKREFRLLVAYGVLSTACLGFAGYLLSTKGFPAAKGFGGLAGLGGGGGSLVMLVKVWGEWSRTDLLLIMVDEASRAQIAAIINRLIKKL